MNVFMLEATSAAALAVAVATALDCFDDVWKPGYYLDKLGHGYSLCLRCAYIYV